MKPLNGIDFLGLGLYFIICIFAIFNISSVDDALGKKQLIFFGISIFIGLIIFFTRSEFFTNFSGIFYLGGILLLLGLFPFGTTILGQRNWYKFGPITVQPVEFSKIGTALMLANYLSSGSFNINNKKSLYTAIAIIIIPALVVLIIPDVGSVLVFSAFFVVLYREGLNGIIFIIVGIFALVFSLSLIFNPIYIIIAMFILALIIMFFISNRFRNKLQSYLVIFGSFIFLSGFSFGSKYILDKMPSHQKARIAVLFEGEKKYKKTTGYNLYFSKTAIGSGGFKGKGYKEGSVTRGKFVPEQETDYIFCTVGEEWGFIGSFSLILVYILYISRIYYLAENQKNSFSRVFGYCFATILLIHFTINLGMIIGLFPTVGIPLPYFSYGGSSLLAFSIMTFIFFKLNYTDKNSLI